MVTMLLCSLLLASSTQRLKVFLKYHQTRTKQEIIVPTLIAQFHNRNGEFIKLPHKKSAHYYKFSAPPIVPYCSCNPKRGVFF